MGMHRGKRIAIIVGLIFASISILVCTLCTDTLIDQWYILLLRFGSDELRRSSCEALADRKCYRSAPVLFERLLEEGESIEVGIANNGYVISPHDSYINGEYFSTLSTMGEHVLELMEEEYRNGDDRRRLCSIWILAQADYSDPLVAAKFEPMFLSALVDLNPTIRSCAARALFDMKIRDVKRARVLLAGMMESGNELERHNAMAVLQNMNVGVGSSSR